MEIVVRQLSELHTPECNARIHPKKQIEELKRSIQKNGQTRLLVIDEDGAIWIGNGLFLAMKELGFTEAHCILKAGMTEHDKKKMMLSDNRIFDLGVDDTDAFASLIQELADDLDIPGYDPEMLETFVADLAGVEDLFPLDEDAATEEQNEQEEEATDAAEEVEVPTVPRSKPGQVYQLGQHRLMCGDSTNMTDVLKLMDGHQAQLLLTDPPYNVNYKGTAGSIENDNMDDSAFRLFLHKAFTAANYVLKPGASLYIWHADSNGLIFREECARVGWQVRQCLIWVKNSLVLGRLPYNYRHEPCIFAAKPGSAQIWAGDRKQTTVFEFPKPRRNDLHPTMKPLELFTIQMTNSSRPGDIVLDLFTGSGTTLIVAEQTDRIAYCMEYDPRFVDVIIDRWELLTGQKARLLTDTDEQPDAENE